MKSKTKKIIITSSLLAGLTAVSVATPLLYIKSQKNNNDGYDYYNAINEENIKNNPLNNQFYYVYDNKRFYTLDDVAEYYINKNNALESEYFIGDPYDSITDQENKIVDISKMRKYYKNRILPAYKNALGDFSHNYNEVKKTYINEGLITYKYDDFNGNIFDTYQEARESILRTKNTSDLLYYQFENGMKYNPLSKSDLLLLKNDIFDNLYKIYRNPNSVNTDNSDFQLKIYDKNVINRSEVTYTSAGSDVFQKENLIRSIVEKAIMEYYNIKYDILNADNNAFNVKLNIKEYGNGSKCRFEFANLYGSDVNITDNNKSLLFKNVPYKELSKFAVFTNAKLFFDNETKRISNEFPKMDLSVKYHITNKQARELEVSEFLRGVGFKVKYRGTDVGGDDGVDIDIMQEGTEKPAHYMMFEAEFINNIPNMNSMIRERYFNKLNELQRQYGENSLLTKINNYIYNKVFNVVSADINNAPNNIKIEDYVAIRSSRPTYAQNEGDLKHTRAKLFNDKTTTKAPSKIEDLLTNNFMIDDGARNTFINLKQQLNIKLDSIIDNRSDLVKYLTNDDFKYVVEYNGKPLFEIDGIINTVNNNNLYDFSFIKNFANYFTNDANKSKLENWKNVSQSFILDKSSDGTPMNRIVEKKHNYFKINQNHELEFVQDGENPIYTEEHIPSFTDREMLDNYRINDITHIFNRQKDKINGGSAGTNPDEDSDSESNSEAEIKQVFNAPEDIVMLYTKEKGRLQPKSLSYRTYLDSGININVAVYNNKYLKLFDNEEESKMFAANTQFLEPSKIVILYDLLGNIANPGVRLTNDESWQTTSDAVYDSKKTIIDNLLRTKLIPIDQYKVFYQEEGYDNYTLIDKRINQIYKLGIDGKNVHFVEFNNALSYLKQYLKINAFKVAY